MNRNLKHLTCFFIFSIFIILPVFFSGAEGWAIDEVPTYERITIGSLLRDIYPQTGISTAAALNEQGDTVGYAIINNQYYAFVYTQEDGVQLLTGLDGWSSNLAVNVSDRDADGRIFIVGRGQSSIYSDPYTGLSHAALWIFNTSTGNTEETIDIGTLPGYQSSNAEAVSNHGLVIGYSRVSTSIGGNTGMVYDINTRLLHAIDVNFNPIDINENHQIIGNTMRARLDQDGLGNYIVVDQEDLGAPPNTSWASLSAINESGWTSGTTTMGFHDGAGRMVHGASRYINDWTVLWANSSFDSANGLNSFGDVVGAIGVSSAIRAVLYIEALGQLYLLEDLQNPPAFLDVAHDINDAGWIAGGNGAAVLLKLGADTPPPPPAVCGDGNVDAGEDCDGSNLNGASCISVGFDGGLLSCAADCSFNTNNCVTDPPPPPPPVCGDGIVDAGEDCDGNNLNGASCTSLGFDSGLLSCNVNCQFDTGNCVTNPPPQPQTADLTVTVDGGGSIIIREPDGTRSRCRNRNGTCTFNYEHGTSLTLIAKPYKRRWRFDHWEGRCAQTTGTTCNLRIIGDDQTTAVFTRK